MPVTRQVIVAKATFVAVDDEIERAAREKKSIRPVATHRSTHDWRPIQKMTPIREGGLFW